MFPVKQVFFSRMTRIPGYPGACTRLSTEEDAPLGTNGHRAKSLVIVEGVHSKLIVDGTYFMSLTSGAVEGWLY